MMVRLSGKKKKKLGGDKEVKKPIKKKTVHVKPSPSLTTRLSRVQLVAERINKKLKGRGRVLVGKEVDELEFEKLRTGNPAMDYVLNGGLIRGAVTQFWGLEACCKTSQLAFTFRTAQSQGLICALAAIEAFDKSWWRSIGVYIPYNDQEFDMMDAELRKRAERYNRIYADAGWAPLILLQHKAGDESLQMVYDMTVSNTVDLIGVDSLGAIVSSRILEERELADEDEMGGEGRLFARFQRFISSALNRYYNDDNEEDPDGKSHNRTTIVCINQARPTFGQGKVYRREKMFHPVGGQALKHLSSQSLFFDAIPSEELSDIVKIDGRTRNDVYAKTFRVFGTKMRGGPPDRDARFVMHVKNNAHGGHWRAGQVDTANVLRAIGASLNIVQQSGAWYEYQGLRAHGSEKFEQLLWNEPEVYQKLYDAVMDEAVRQTSAGQVPEATVRHV